MLPGPMLKKGGPDMALDLEEKSDKQSDKRVVVISINSIKRGIAHG